MIKTVLSIFALFLPASASVAMLRAPRRSPMPNTLKSVSPARRLVATARYTPRNKLEKYIIENGGKIPKNNIDYGQVGKQIYVQLIALRIVQSQHCQKYNSENSISAKFPTEQDEAYDRLVSTTDEFEEAFIDSEPRDLFSDIQEKKVTPPTEEQLIQAVKAAITVFENKLADPQNKI